MTTGIMIASGTHPNGVENIRPAWGMLLLRPALALPLQCLFAAGFALGGQADPGAWLLTGGWGLALGEFVNLWLLARLSNCEGLRLRDLYNRQAGGGRRDLRWL